MHILEQYLPKKKVWTIGPSRHNAKSVRNIKFFMLFCVNWWTVRLPLAYILPGYTSWKLETPYHGVHSGTSPNRFGMVRNIRRGG